jgi:hypothetical protein
MPVRPRPSAPFKFNMLDIAQRFTQETYPQAESTQKYT